jgi:hypothetical protein
MNTKPSVEELKDKEGKHYLETITWGVMAIVNYQGCLVSKNKTGYSVFGLSCKTPKEVDMEIDKRLKRIGKSLIQ